MTEITAYTGQLPAPVERFVLHWGDMGGHWGVNRSVAQIHALLYLSHRPLAAEDIAASLGMARSNVSNSIKELQSWNLIRRVPVRNDRRRSLRGRDRSLGDVPAHRCRPQGARDRSAVARWRARRKRPGMMVDDVARARLRRARPST
jgi:hypothetical protein